MRDRTIFARDAARLAACFIACAWGLPGQGLADIVESLLRQPVSEQREAWLGVGYDLTSAAGRFRDWLRAHTASPQRRPESTPATHPRPQQEARPKPQPPSWPAAQAREPAAQRASDRAVTALYDAHYQPLVRLAALLVRDMATAEQVVQDSFVALHRTRRWQDTGVAVSYLHEAVVHRSRLALRRRTAPGAGAAGCPPGGAGGSQRPGGAWQHPAVLTALHALPARQREVLVLRCYAELPEAQVAAIIGISEGAVQGYTARAMSSLRAALEIPGE